MITPEQLQCVQAFFIDLDGVLTDGSILIWANEQVKKMNAKDCYAIQWAIRQKYILAIISGDAPESAYAKLKSLGIEELYFGVPDKSIVYKALKEKYQLLDENIIYLGDDLPDYPVMRMARIAVAPADAASDILGIADYITKAKGGEGVVREIIEQVMKAQGTWYNSGLTFS